MKNEINKFSFNEFQQDVLIEVFDNLDKLSKFKRNGKNFNINPNKKDGNWVFGLERWIPFFNEFFTRKQAQIKHLTKIVRYYNSPKYYNINDSKEIILDSIARLSKKYSSDRIVLTYTTALSPSLEKFPSWVWDELSSREWFKKEDFGNIDFIDALLELKKENFLEIKEFEIMALDGSSFTFRVIVKCLDKTEKYLKNRSSENIKKNSKDIEAFPFKLPAGVRWENFMVKFLSDYEIKIEVIGKKYNATFRELGLEDSRTKKPNQQWYFLKILSENNGELSCKNPKANPIYKKSKELLSKALKRYFKIDYDPFYSYKPSFGGEKEKNSYKIKLTLIPMPTEKEEKKKKYNPFSDVNDFIEESSPLR